jgi:aspartate/methionine/tyrosine aminotransferase
VINKKKFLNFYILSHPRGRPRLRNALAASYSKQFDRELDPETEILVTAGANEGIILTSRLRAWIVN